MKKKNKIIIVLGLLFLSIIGGFTIYSKTQDTSSPLIAINSQKLISNLDMKKDIWIYIGRPTCEECKKFAPVLEETFREKQQKIYYYNTDSERNTNEEDMLGVIDRLNVQIVPTVIHLKGGEVVKESIGYKDKKNLEKVFEP